ncbi:MAG: superoxide dismutase family protein [Bdellovibrionaceae bacterium]|nr:superoxide dismutase family protein [Pseudobdellovibrionaceae bacterium]
MKTLIATTIVTIALCSACASKDTSTTTVAQEGNPAPVESQGPTSAEAVFTAAKKQKAKGTIHFMQVGDSVNVKGTLTGLKPGKHGFHIHEKGDCSVDGFASAGGHFNPMNESHGAADASVKHAGDMGNITADKKGNATYKMELKGMKVSGAMGIIGKAVIIHDKPDDLKTQPAGDAGGRVACSVIEAK